MSLLFNFLKNFVLARLFSTETTLTLQFISALYSPGNISKLRFMGFNSTENFPKWVYFWRSIEFGTVT